MAAAYRREIENAPSPESHRKMLEERLQRIRSPFPAAEAGSVTEMIDPRDTRPLTCRFVEAIQPAIARHTARKLHEDRLRPVRP